jgi:spermidine/putrescine transport system permease protein
MNHESTFRFFSLSINWSWLIIFALLPFCMIGIASFLTGNATHLLDWPLTFINYIQINNSIYLKIFRDSFKLAGLSTIICLLLGYPFAFIIARFQGRIKAALLLLIIIPFWTSSLIRTYSMITLLKPKGVINSILLQLGFIHKPLQMLFSDTAVVIGCVYNLLPFMILPLLTNIERLERPLIDAARDLGANRITTFQKIILPLTMPGIISGCILVFLPAMTIFYIPDLLGGAKTILLGNLIQNQFLIAQNWPLGSAISVVFTLLLIALLAIYWRSTRGREHHKLL